VKSAVAAANNAYESVHKAAKQAAEVAEANFQAMTNTAVKATDQGQALGLIGPVKPPRSPSGPQIARQLIDRR
jgi:hypothetical protein